MDLVSNIQYIESKQVKYDSSPASNDLSMPPTGEVLVGKLHEQESAKRISPPMKKKIYIICIYLYR